MIKRKLSLPVSRTGTHRIYCLGGIEMKGQEGNSGLRCCVERNNSCVLPVPDLQSLSMHSSSAPSPPDLPLRLSRIVWNLTNHAEYQALAYPLDRPPSQPLPPSLQGCIHLLTGRSPLPPTPLASILPLPIPSVPSFILPIPPPPSQISPSPQAPSLTKY